MKIKVLTNDGRLTRKVQDIIRTYENMGVDVKRTLSKKLVELKQQSLLESFFGEEQHIVNDQIQTTRDRIKALEEVLSAL